MIEAAVAKGILLWHNLDDRRVPCTRGDCSSCVQSSQLHLSWLQAELRQPGLECVAGLFEGWGGKPAYLPAHCACAAVLRTCAWSSMMYWWHSVEHAGIEFIRQLVGAHVCVC